MKKIFLILVALFGMAALFAESETGQKKYIGKDGSVSVALTTPSFVVEPENEAKGAAVDGADIGKYIGRDGAASITLLPPPPPEMEEAAAGEKDGLDEIQIMAQKVLALAQKKAGTNFKEYKGNVNLWMSQAFYPTVELKNIYIFTYLCRSARDSNHGVEPAHGFAIAEGEGCKNDREMIKKIKELGKAYGWKGSLAADVKIEKAFPTIGGFKDYLSDYEKASDEVAEILKFFK